jgi:acetyl-CoA carboxylase carboxyl transferase subunit beta
MTETLAPPRRTGAAWVRCRRCGDLVYGKRFDRELLVCPSCGWHAPAPATERLDQLMDADGREPVGFLDTVADPLGFTDTRPYPARLAEARERTGLDEAVVCLRGSVLGRPAVIAVMDFRFLGGSLGSGVGERLTAAAETALRERLPLVIVTASGGARMQEGALSLMQMAKTSQALAELDEAGLLTVTVVTDPTYGGVAASFAALTDVILAEPGARFGFAGPRVIEQTMRRALPPGFQTAEFLFQRGLIDEVVARNGLRTHLARLLDCTGSRHRPDDDPPARLRDVVVTDPDELVAMPPWEAVRGARDTDRPTTLDYFGYMLDGFTELHGDRTAGDCPAIVGGPGLLGGRPVMAIGHQKGHTTRELLDRNFAMPSPAGYRKSSRLMRMAAKLGLPVVTLIDTPGAYPGQEAEENGQAIVIAQNLRQMATLPVPTVAVVTGEGGSGGALALAFADRVLMLERAVYSVISPEGCAAILWQSRAAAARAADALRLTAPHLLRLGIVDGVVREPAGGAQADHAAAAEQLRAAVEAALGELPIDPHQLRRDRYRRYREFGVHTSGAATGRPR